jgi:hypothetical protein
MLRRESNVFGQSAKGTSVQLLAGEVVPGATAWLTLIAVSVVSVVFLPKDKISRYAWERQWSRNEAMTSMFLSQPFADKIN